jgi:hypothetical protein
VLKHALENPYDRASYSRILSKCRQHPGTKCWEFFGSRVKFGYGHIHFKVNGKNTQINAHRGMWISLFGPLKSEDVILHNCDNPKCVNPGHLSKGTRTDNIRDMIKKKRAWIQQPGNQVGSKNHASKLTEAHVYEIKNLLNQKVSYAKISKAYGVSIGAIGKIARRQTWTHVGIKPL